MIKCLLYALSLCLLSIQVSYAQTRTISGKVSDLESGQGLPGVSIFIEGTTTGTITDVDGNYSITAATGNVLVYQSVGYIAQKITLGTESTLNVTLTTDTQQLNEVIVIGYGIQEKRSLTGNIAKVSGATIENTAVPTFEQAIQGRAAGVFVESQNGKLGQGIKIRVRGASSLSAGSEPLYVVDGIPITSQSQSSTSANTNPLADINFNDIESIEVLKDASAASIYGSRASNGVVLITTKKGKAGKTKLNINYFKGFSKETDRREFMNAEQYATYFREAAENAFALDPSFDYVSFNEGRLQRYGAGDPDWESNNVDTDWQDEVFRTGEVDQIDVNASGGNDKTRFYIAGQYMDQEGILIGNRFQRLSGRINLDHTINKRLTVGMNLSLSRTENDRLSNDNAFSTPIQIVALSPTTPVIDPRTGLLSGQLDNNTGLPNTNYPVYYNPLLGLENGFYKAVVFRNIGNLFASFNIIKDLVFRSEIGVDILSQTEEAYYGSATSRNTGTPNGFGSNYYTLVTNYNTNNFLTYTKILEKHTIEATGGMSYQQSNTDLNTVEGQNFVSDSYKTLFSAAQITAGTSRKTAFSFLSYFLRANYRFNEKYLISLSGRIDASSRFGKDNRYGFFPAASAGWVITEERFMENIKFLSFLKLRLSYGLTGNAEIDNFASRGLFGSSGYVGVPGQAPTQIENQNLKWETTAQTDIGLEFGLFNGRLTGELDYYIKKTSDLLLNVNIPGTTGFRTAIANVGKLENKGVEIVLNSQNFVGEFTWSTSLNLAHNKNEVTDLDGQQLGDNDLNRAIEGQPIGVFFGREFAGADPDNGDALYVRNITNADGSIDKSLTNDYNEAQNVVLGNPNPNWIGGITNTFSYKGFDLSIFFQGVFGNDIYNGGGQYMSASGSNGYDNQTLDQLRAWQNPGDITDVPEARLFFANGTNPSSRYLSKGSYVRLKTLTFGYNFPQSIVSKIKMEKLRIYFSAQNLLTFTDYEGWDPEVNADYQATNINQGVDFYSAPQAKTISFGVNLGF
ncbi:MAG: TonB-dependent receptor [Microscillaceae bacterium]|nr:TonB-dependent receptor [Microscillaceae bacterium]